MPATTSNQLTGTAAKINRAPRKRSRVLRTLTSVVAGAMALATLTVAGSAAYDSSASAAALSAYPPPGQFASLATGERVHYVCAGEGEPAVVLFAGFGGDVLD